MSRKSISLVLQLLLVLAGVVIVTSLALAFAAYRSVHFDLVADARRLVRASADQMAVTVTRVVEQHESLAEGFLSSVYSLCGEKGSDGRTGWELGCVNQALTEFRATDHPAGIVFKDRGRTIASAGADVSDEVPVVPGFASVTTRSGYPAYVVTAKAGDTLLIEHFPTDELSVLFLNQPAFGAHSEIFLADGSGAFLAAPRDPRSSANAATLIEPVADCMRQPSEAVGPDYRGVKSFHGMRPVPIFLGGACVDAHVPYDEAVAPAEILLTQLAVRGSLFVCIGVLLSVIVARRIAAPAKRLAAAAREVEHGRFDTAVPIQGPSEIRALGRALASMQRAIAELLGREQVARREAEAANRMKDEFLATVSHELRNPLTSILGWTQLLRATNADGQTVARALGAIEAAAETQSRLVEDLLDVSRIVAGRLQIQRVPVSLLEIVEGALDSVRPNAESKRVALTSKIEPSVPLVLGDASRLRQVAVNLLTNAIKFTPEGGSVSLRLRPVTARGVELTVSDTGAGIAPEFLPHVFERFRQEEVQPGKSGGLGLGLAIAEHLVKLHGGSISADSAGVNQGATFTVTLPAYDQALVWPAEHGDGIVVREPEPVGEAGE